MRRAFLISILLVLNYSLLIPNNTNAQDWTACYNGMFNGAYGVQSIEKCNNYLFVGLADYHGGSGNGTLYRSSDNGLNWFMMNCPIPSFTINTFFVSGTELYAGTGGGGIYYTSNYGQNWLALGSGQVTAIIKSGPNLLMVLQTLFCSTNNGLNWDVVTNWPQYHVCYSFLTVNNLLFAGTSHGVHYSTDNGINWSEKGLQSSVINKLYYFQGSIFAGANDTIYKSTNEGLNWSPCHSGINIPGPGAYSFSSINNLLFAGTFRGIYYTSNGGNNWFAVNSGVGTPRISALLTSGTKLYAGANFDKYGLFATTNNGQNWFKSGFNPFNVTSLILNGNILFAGTDSSGIYYSSNEGSTWYPAKNELNNNYISCLIKHESNIFAGTIDSGVYKSSNNGQNWSPINSGLSNLFIKTFYSKDTILYAGTNSGIYKTTNNGLNWALYGLSATAINAIIIQNNNLLIGTDNGILITTNNGLSWTPWLLSGKSIKGFYIFQNKIYSGTNSGVYNSSDNGFTWNQIGLSSYSVNSFANFSDTLVCSSSYGVFVSSNGGNNWIWLGLQYLGGTRSILVFNNNIYACGITGSSGEVSGCVWRRIASTQSGIRNISGEIVSNYFLYQNYPNPFNPSTKIKFDIQNRSPIGALGDDRVVLKIYDILGKEVAVLVNEQLQPGSYEVTFDGSNLSSGIYFYRLRAGEYVETKRMVLIK